MRASTASTEPGARRPTGVKSSDPAGVWSPGGSFGTLGGSRGKLQGATSITASLGCVSKPAQPRHAQPRHATPRHTPRHAMPCHAMPCHAASCVARRLAEGGPGPLTHTPTTKQPSLGRAIPQLLATAPSRPPAARYSLRDLSLARAGAAEGWLEDMLEIAPKGGAVALGLTPLRGLARVGLARPQLQGEGLVPEEVERLYQLLFVYSVGLQHSVQQSLKRLTEAASAPIALRWWRALVAVAERLLRTEARPAHRTTHTTHCTPHTAHHTPHTAHHTPPCSRLTTPHTAHSRRATKRSRGSRRAVSSWTRLTTSPRAARCCRRSPRCAD